MPDTDLPSSSRIVIIGGGVGGTSIAFHLAQMGCSDVLLLERDELTNGSTFHSAGLVGQLRSSVTLTAMMMYSAELYRNLAQDPDLHPGWVQSGGIRLASTPPRLEELRRKSDGQKHLDYRLKRSRSTKFKSYFLSSTHKAYLGLLIYQQTVT